MKTQRDPQDPTGRVSVPANERKNGRWTNRPTNEQLDADPNGKNYFSFVSLSLNALSTSSRNLITTKVSLTECALIWRLVAWTSSWQFTVLFLRHQKFEISRKRMMSAGGDRVPFRGHGCEARRRWTVVKSYNRRLTSFSRCTYFSLLSRPKFNYSKLFLSWLIVLRLYAITPASWRWGFHLFVCCVSWWYRYRISSEQKAINHFSADSLSWLTATCHAMALCESAWWRKHDFS